MRPDVASVIAGTCGTAASTLTVDLGRAGVSPVSDRQSYKSDLSDERWALIEPVISAWKARHRSVSGHQGNYDMREIVNALLYQSRTVLGPPLALVCESRRPSPLRSPGRSRRAASPGAPGAAGVTRQPRSTRPSGASRSYPSRSQAPAAGVPRRSRCAARTGCPGAPAGPDAASFLFAESAVQSWAAAVRSPPTVRHRHPMAWAEPPRTPGSRVPERANHLEDHFVRSSGRLVAWGRLTDVVRGDRVSGGASKVVL